MNFLSFLSPPLTGIDIQNQCIRLVQCKKTHNGFLLMQAIKSDLPADVFNEGKIENWDGLYAHLSKLTKHYRLRGAACIGLPANLVRMQSITLPIGLTKTDIEAEIKLRMHSDLPGMADALCLDYQRLPAENNGDMEVKFAATREEYLYNYVECINATDLKVKLVDIDIYALQRALCYALPRESVSAEMNTFLCVSDFNATLLVFNQDDIIFHQQWQRTEKNNFPMQLKYWMQLCLSRMQSSKMNKLTVCATNELLALLIADTKNQDSTECQYEFISPNLFASMKILPSVECEQLLSSTMDFALACGLAMREVTQW